MGAERLLPPLLERVACAGGHSVRGSRLSEPARLLVQCTLHRTSHDLSMISSRLACAGGLVAPVIRSALSAHTASRFSHLPRRSFAHLVPGTPLAPSQSQPLHHVDELSHSEGAFGYNSTDAMLEDNRLDASQMADPTNRTFTYLMQGSAAFMYASFGRLAVMKFVSFLSASADVMAVASMEVEISAIAEGNATTVKWRGKPVFIRHRTPKEIHSAQADDHAALRDPQTDAQRFHDKPEWAVLVGVCTHLGCGQDALSHTQPHVHNTPSSPHTRAARTSTSPTAADSAAARCCVGCSPAGCV